MRSFGRYVAEGWARADGNHASDPAYLYHATNEEAAYDIARSGLKPFRPDHGTDQSCWPDGKTNPRVYCSPNARAVWAFAPAEGRSVILRFKRSSGNFRNELNTGDVYSEKLVPASVIEILKDDGKWVPLTSLNEAVDPRIARLDAKQKKQYDQIAEYGREDGESEARIASRQEAFLNRYASEGKPEGRFEDEIHAMLKAHHPAGQIIHPTLGWNPASKPFIAAMNKRWPGVWTTQQLFNAFKGNAGDKDFDSYGASEYLAKLALKKGYKPKLNEGASQAPLLRSSAPTPGYMTVRAYFKQKQAGALTCQRVWGLDAELEAGVRSRVGAPIILHVDDLIPTQHHCEAADVQGIVAGYHKGKPTNAIDVALINGRYYIVNGHHRAAASIVAGRLTIRCYVHII